MKIENVKIGTRVEVKSEYIVCGAREFGEVVSVYNDGEVHVQLDGSLQVYQYLAEDLRLESKPKKSKEDPKIYTFKEILKISGVYKPIDGIMAGCKIIIELDGDNLYVSGDGTHVCTLYETSWVNNKFVKTNLDYKMKFKEIE
jgi:hypothetical protein